MIQFRFLGSKKALVQSLIIACWGVPALEFQDPGFMLLGVRH